MTKKELTSKCKEILHSNIDKTLNEEDTAWLWNNIFYYHPNRTYTFDDIVSITPKHNWDYGNKNIAFEIVTADGTKDYWSYVKCIANRPKSTLKNI